MYISCTFFFGELDRHEPRYAIANGVRALALTHHATGEDFSYGFRRDLSVVKCTKTGLTAADIFDEIVTRVKLKAGPGRPSAAAPDADSDTWPSRSGRIRDP
jgi:hypothetical protein